MSQSRGERKGKQKGQGGEDEDFNEYIIYRDVIAIEASGTLSEFSGEADWSVITSAITSESPYVINLSADEQYQLELDFTGIDLPTSLNISWSGSGRIIVLDKEFNQQVCNSSPCSVVTNNIFYLKIINNDSSAKNFTLTTTGNDLPLGIRLNVTGDYKGQMRRLRIDRNNWQIY